MRHHGQNPRKDSLSRCSHASKGGVLSHFFPLQIGFSWVGIDFMSETDYKKPSATKSSANTVLIVIVISRPRHASRVPRFL